MSGEPGQLDIVSPGPEDLSCAARIAAEALADSPPYKFACGEAGDRNARERFLEFLFLRNFQMALRFGFCRGAFETFNGEDGEETRRELVCFFMFVPQEGGPMQPSLCDMLRAGMVGSVFRFGLRPTWELVKITRWAEEVEEEILRGRKVIRLEGMVVCPSKQSKGIGTRTLRPALDEADELCLEVFLATQEERSLAFYQRLGFAVVREEAYPPGGFTSWFMLRAPGGAGAAAP